MATLKADVLSKLITATSGILTGGIFTSDDIDVPSGGGWEWAKSEDVGLVENLTLTPHGILRWKDSMSYQTESARHLEAEQAAAELYMYADFGGYATLESAIKPIKDAFPIGVVYTADDSDLYDVRFAGVFGEMPAQEYQYRPSMMIRLEIIRRRT